ncbi:Mor transcription activator family protein [Thauera propionica]|uniref:Mor transcription activator family protein n=1 Tax=Thauera propionica TaxID=2019431 RepID=UPI0023F35AF8|nr:Mor transcription activator family protein [Thauera propionica]MDD3675903.1 Mor transcription activator family protein [Thauera propionica]
MNSDCATLADVFTDVLTRELHLPATVAETLADALIVGAAKLGHGGTTYHLHTLDYLTRDQIAARVRAEYNGRNVQTLARRYGKNRSTIYRILRRNEME